MPPITETPTLFDTRPRYDRSRYQVRAPKRRTRGYAAQVWARGGYWDLGLHPSRAEARLAAEEFAAGSPAAGVDRPECWHGRRSDGHRSRYRDVRRVKGGAYQARVWYGKGISLNLGLFTTGEFGEGDAGAEWSAARAAREFRRQWKPGVAAGAALDAVRARGYLPERRVSWPAGWRELVTPAANGPTETAAERKTRERRSRSAKRAWYRRKSYPGGGLLGLLDDDGPAVAA